MAQTAPTRTRYYPSIRTVTGWTILFMVCLRVAIGWHFFYEGYYKMRTADGNFSSTPYLMASVGPFKDLFHAMVDDMDGTAKRTTQKYLYDKLDEKYNTILKHYGIQGDTGYQDEKLVKQILELKAKGEALSDNDKANLERESKKLTRAQVESLKAFVERKKHGVPDANTVNALFDDEKLFSKQYVSAGEYVKASGKDPNTANNTAFVSEVIVTARPEMQDEIVARIQKLISDLEDTVRKGVTEPSLRGPDEEEENIRKQIEGLKAELPKAAIVPAGVTDSSWIKKDYVNSLIDKRYDELKKAYALTDRQHQSKYGWRYRDQKKQGHHDRNNVDFILSDPDFTKALADYKALLEQIEREEEDLKALSLKEQHSRQNFDDQRLAFNLKKRDSLRNNLLKPPAPRLGVESPLADVDLQKIQGFGEYIGPIKDMTAAQFSVGPVPMNPRSFDFLGRQLQKAGVVVPKQTLTYYQDIAMMLGLTVIGACLILGLFTRLASLGGAVMLLMFYLAMPPFPGVHVPENAAEGHYLFVNKNLIEMLALLMFATSGIGRWFGLDAFLHALFGRRQREVVEATAPAIEVGTSGQGRVYIPEARAGARDGNRG